MKNKLFLIAALSAAVAGCEKPKEPKLENFTSSGQLFTRVDCVSSEPVILLDSDGDREVDAIIQQKPRFILYSAEGYNDKFRDIGYTTDFTKTMTPEFRDAASRLFKANQDLGYEAARQGYKDYESRRNTWPGLTDD